MMFSIIVNPASGNKKGDELALQVGEILSNRGIEYKIYRSKQKGDPVVLAENAALDGCDHLVGIGGDGTVSEIIDIVVKYKMVLFLVPNGTGNDFMRMLNLPEDPITAFEMQLDGKVHKLDCGRYNGKCFINISGSGFDVEVLERTEELKSVYSGAKAYRKALIQVIRDFRPFDAEITIDDLPKKDISCTIIEVANGKYFGGGMRVAPGADIQDGKFQVILIKKYPRVIMLLLLPLFLLGWHVRFGLASEIQAKKVVITSKNMTVNIDGRLEKIDQVLYEVCPGEVLMQLPV